jgi:hypothetical protein
MRVPPNPQLPPSTGFPCTPSEQGPLRTGREPLKMRAISCNAMSPPHPEATILPTLPENLPLVHQPPTSPQAPQSSPLSNISQCRPWCFRPSAAPPVRCTPRLPPQDTTGQHPPSSSSPGQRQRSVHRADEDEESRAVWASGPPRSQCEAGLKARGQLVILSEGEGKGLQSHNCPSLRVSL